MRASKAMRKVEKERRARANRPDRRRASLSGWKPGTGSGRGRRSAPLCPPGAADRAAPLGLGRLRLHLALIPAGAIALLTVAVNFVVDWMLYRSSSLKG